MSEVAIHVSGLGKRYRIGAQQEAYKTLREKINDTALAPFRAAKHLLTRNGTGKTLTGDGRPTTAGNGHQSSVSGQSHRSSVIRQSRETFWALRDVSFEIKRGEVVGVIGRNGAGKSTLLKILSRITEPTEGYADIKGRIASLLEVGTGFHPELTGRENIFLNGSILGMKRAEINQKFDEIVAFAEIDKFIDTPVKYYSSGMYVRLAFAVAAHLDPDILLVDEVLAVGDAAFQKKCLGKMGDVAKEGRTVLFVSHNMGAVRRLCQNGIVLEQGRVSCSGPVASCITDYMSEAGKRFNLITDHISYADPAIQIESITVNGSPNDQLDILTTTNYLDIEVKGHLSKPMRLDLEAKIFDLYESPLAAFSLAQENGVTELYPTGGFRINVHVELPSRMLRGEFYLYLALTHPGIETWVYLPKGLRLFVEGFSTKTGRRFNYYDGAGFLSLSSKTARSAE